MPSELDRYRVVNRLRFVPSYMSLGLPPEVFRDGVTPTRTGFDAVLSGLGDTLYLFKGEDFIAYDLRTDKITQEMKPIAGSWVAGSLPDRFTFGLDAACWAGPEFPRIVFLFRDGEFVRINTGGVACPADWQMEEEPIQIAQEWLRPSPSEFGVDLGPATLLYGLRGDQHHVHFFGHGGSYARHNLMDGLVDDGPVPIGERFQLPESFLTRIDIAFYGAGEEAEHIFFFSGFQYAEYDIRQRRLVATAPSKSAFPL